MPDLVRLRNVDPRKQALEVPSLGNKVVDPDCVVDIPARLLNHQAGCTDKECGGCMVWPADTWRVESGPKSKTSQTVKE